MTSKEILRRVTGISSPIGGIQWDAPPPAVKIARDLITELEDCRVLYAPTDLENADHCVQSVDQIRKMLTEALKELEYQSPLDKQIRRMRKAARRFMDRVEHQGFDSFAEPVRDSILERELHELRHKFGDAIAEISVSYEVDVGNDLASTVPFDDKSL